MSSTGRPAPLAASTAVMMPSCPTTYNVGSPPRHARSTGASTSVTVTSSTCGSPTLDDGLAVVSGASGGVGGGRAGRGRCIGSGGWRRRRRGDGARVARRCARRGRRRRDDDRTAVVASVVGVVVGAGARRERQHADDDDDGSRRHRRARVRIRPSCTTVTASFPSRVKMFPPASPRAELAESARWS